MFLRKLLGRAPNPARKARQIARRNAVGLALDAKAAVADSRAEREYIIMQEQYRRRMLAAGRRGRV